MSQAWRAAAADTQTSTVQKLFAASLKQIGVPNQLEYRTEQTADLSIDIAVPQHRLAIEVDGPWHFAMNSRRRLGASLASDASHQAAAGRSSE